MDTEAKLIDLMTKWRTAKPVPITQVFLAPMTSWDGKREHVASWQCELGMGDETTKVFHQPTLSAAISDAHAWAYFTHRFEEYASAEKPAADAPVGKRCPHCDCMNAPDHLKCDDCAADF